MLADQVAKKYGQALFELAGEKGLVDQAWDQFYVLAEYMKKDKTLLDFMDAPQIPNENKLTVIERAFAGWLEKPFYDFILVLADKHRIKYLPDIIKHFDELVRRDKGIVQATCITTFPISEQERRMLIERLEKKTSQKIELVERIDRRIIGGMIVLVGGRIIDGSIRQSLDMLKSRLMKVKVH